MGNSVFRRPVPIADYIRKGKEYKVLKAFKKGCPHDIVDKQGKTFLHLAAEYGRYDVTACLIDMHVDIDAQDHNGQTPLMLAALNHHPDVISCLLRHKANILICDNNGLCPIQALDKKFIERDDQFILEVLLALDKQYHHDSEKVGLKLASLGFPLRLAMHLKDSHVTRIMLDSGCSVDAVDPILRKTALRIAFENRSSENIKLLLEYGADIDIIDYVGDITYANYGLIYDPFSLRKHLVQDQEIVSIILNHSKLHSTPNCDGFMQMRNLLRNATKETLLTILRSEVDLSAKDSYDISVMHYLAENPCLDDVVDEMRGKKFDPNARNKMGESVLFTAVSNGNYKFLKLCLERGGNPNIQNNDQFSPLFILLRHLPYTNINVDRIRACAELLLTYGADPQLVINDSTTLFNSTSSLELEVQYPMLGQLAILVDSGTPIVEEIQRRLNLSPELRNKFTISRQQLDDLKKTVVWESITLFQLMTESKENISKYARNEEFLSNINSFNNDFSKNSYYCNRLRRNIEEAIQYKEDKRELAEIFCDATGLIYQSYYVIIEKIVTYALG